MFKLRYFILFPVCFLIFFLLFPASAIGESFVETPRKELPRKVEVEEPCSFEIHLCDEQEVETVRFVTAEEYRLLLRVCMSEAGNQPLEGKIAVVETVLNRVDMGKGTIEEVITAKRQYSTADNGEPNKECYEAVDKALSGDMYPDTMLYFRTEHFHTFGIPYEKIGDHYFSLEEEN